MAEVICLGILVADVIARPVDSYPGPGQLMQCAEMRTSLGGCAANTAVGLSRMGINTSVMGKVGQDGFGSYVRDTLVSNGVDTTAVVTDPDTATSATMVLVGSGGERSFIHYTGANAAFTEQDVNWDAMEGARLLHVAGHFVMPRFDGQPCAGVLREARRRGLKTALDTAGDVNDGWMATIRPALPYIDYFVPSYEEALACALQIGAHHNSPRAVAQLFLDEGVGVVALKMGERGSYIRSSHDEWIIPPYTVQAVDATGAGDAFAAGLIAGIVRGFDLERSGKLGNAAGACCVTRMGAIDGLRSMEDTWRFVGA